MLSFYLSLVDNLTDKEKVEKIYTEYYGLMMHIAFGYMQENTEDVVHDAMIRIIKNIDKVDITDQPIKTTVKTNNETEVVTNVQYDILGRTTSVTDDGKTTSYTYDNSGLLSEVSPEGTTSYEYTNGNLTKKINPDLTEEHYAYDSFGNLTSHDYNGYVFTYNTLGSLLTVSTDQQLVSYTYSADTNQNLLGSDYGNGQSIDYAYNEDNELTAINIGDETKFGYAYGEETDESGNTNDTVEISDYVNNIKKIISDNKITVNNLNTEKNIYTVETVSKDETDDTGFDGVITRTYTKLGQTYTTKYGENKDEYVGEFSQATKTYEYDGYGNLTKTSYYDRMTTEYEYNSDKLVSLLENTLANLTQSYDYTYDKNGNIKSETLTETAAGDDGETVETTETTNYTYDESNQLSSAENNSTKWKYAYDNRGNILSKKKYAISVDEAGEKVYTESENNVYTYDAVWKDKLTSFNGQAITYDTSGNPLNYRGHTLTWEYGRQLASFDNITYTYNEDGIRTSKTVDGETTNYYLNGTQLFEQANDDYALHFFYDRNGELAGFIYFYLSTGVDDPIQYQYYYVKNAQGDITGITDIFGTLVAKYEYDAWGKLINVESYNEINDPDAANINPFRYRGYYYDTETGLYYLQSRYYDPEVGRFINCDDVNYIGYSGTETSYNAFAYCENDPVNSLDYNGFWGEDVHSGYYEYKVSIRGNKITIYSTQKFITYNNVKYIYGTYAWALYVGIKKEYAKKIAKACNDVDKLFNGGKFFDSTPPVIPTKSCQSWHFNTNSKGIDSRLNHFIDCCEKAGDYFYEAKKLLKSGNAKKANKKIDQGLLYLGRALHPLQDMYAHTSQVTKRSKLGFLYHDKKYDNKLVDGAQDHADIIVAKVAPECIEILKMVADEYPFLRG